MIESNNQKQPSKFWKLTIRLVFVSFCIYGIFQLIFPNFDFNKRNANPFNNGGNLKDERHDKNSKSYGNITIYLPKIVGMVECSDSSVLNYHMNKLKIDKSSLYIAYYLNDSIFNNLITNGTQNYIDDYMLVYSTYDLFNRKSNESDLNRATQDLANVHGNFSDEIDKVAKKLDSISLKAKIGDFVLLESYKLTKNTNTFVYLSKVQFNNKEYVRICILNTLLVNHLILFSTYYKEYEGINSVKDAKKKNDYMVLLFIKENS